MEMTSLFLLFNPPLVGDAGLILPFTTKVRSVLDVILIK